MTKDLEAARNGAAGELKQIILRAVDELEKLGAGTDVSIDWLELRTKRYRDALIDIEESSRTTSSTEWAKRVARAQFVEHISIADALTGDGVTIESVRTNVSRRLRASAWYARQPELEKLIQGLEAAGDEDGLNHELEGIFNLADADNVWLRADR